MYLEYKSYRKALSVLLKKNLSVNKYKNHGFILLNKFLRSINEIHWLMKHKALYICCSYLIINSTITQQFIKIFIKQWYRNLYFWSTLADAFHIHLTSMGMWSYWCFLFLSFFFFPKNKQLSINPIQFWRNAFLPRSVRW